VRGILLGGVFKLVGTPVVDRIRSPLEKSEPVIENDHLKDHSEGITDRSHDRPQSAAHVIEHGKYLFLTPGDSEILEVIVFEEFQERPFNSAKLPAVSNRREDAVLCLYADDDRYRGVLRERYQNEPDNDDGYELASPYEPGKPVVRPRGFKSDSATRNNEYSDQYRNGGE
jgi:hypothetical protein